MSVSLKEVPKPLTVFYRGGGQQATKETPHVSTLKLVVKVLVLFHYASDKTVPWNYTSQTVTSKPQVVAEQRPKKSFNDITGTGRMTRNGRCYTPITTKAKKGENFAENEGVKITALKKKKIKSRLTSQSPRWRRTSS